jgi:hypothetical protein
VGLTSVRRPHPYDAEIPEGNGVMLVPSQSGELVAQKVEQYEKVAPTEYDFNALPLYVETYFPFTRLVRGAGEKTQSSKQSKAYYYAIDADCSIGGYPAKGPLLHAQVPPLSGEVRDATAALKAGTLTEFAGAGRYVLERTGDGGTAWAVSKDFGVGRQVQQMARFKNAGAGTITDALYVALDNGEFWQFDGTTWNAGPALEGDGSAFFGYHVEVVDDRLYRSCGASGNVVRSVTNDPMTTANWSGPITVGDGSSPITWLRSFNKTVWIFKTIGPFTLNADGSDNELDPAMRTQPSVENGRGAWVWDNALWFRHGDSYYRVVVEGETALPQPIGPERLLTNDSETRGVTTCGIGHGSNFAYFGVYNAANGNSYLWKFGTWLNPQETESGKWEFVEAYHGALKKWTGRRITALRVSNTVTGNDRLYCYFADGGVDWCYLPKGTPNPWASGSGCEFTAGSAYVYGPDHHAMAPADHKAYRGFSAFGPVLDTDDTVTVGYRLSQSGVYSTVGPFTTHSQRIDTPDNTFGKVLQYYLKLDSPDSTSTPVLEGITVHHAVRPDQILHSKCTVDAQNHRARRDGMVDRKTAEQIRDTVKQASQAPGSVSVLFDETPQAVSFVNYAERRLNRLQRYGPGWHIDVEAVAFRTNTQYGTIDRLGLTVDELGPYTVDDLGVI